MKKGYVPKNTDLDTKKCVCLFEEWAKQRNDRYPNEPVPSHILDGKDRVALCTWAVQVLCRSEEGRWHSVPSKEHSPLRCRCTALHPDERWI